MPRIMKRISSLLLTLLLVITLFSAAVIPAHAAAEYEYTDPYVVAHLPDTIEGYEQFQKRYYWMTPHEMRWNETDPATGSTYPCAYNPGMGHLINMNKIASGPSAGEEGTPYASIPAYCVDVRISTEENYYYRRINLEDSSFYDDTAAGRIRAIVLNSFPYIEDMATIQSAANTWLAANKTEYAPITGLTGAEAMLATQAALWTVANPDVFELTDAYAYSEDFSSDEEEMRGKILYPDTLVNVFETPGENTDNNVTLLTEYLTSLPSVSPRAQLVSDNTLTLDSVDTTSEADGTYTITVSFITNATVSSKDDLTVTVFAGEKSESFALTAENINAVHSVTLSGLSEPGEIKVEINGTQTAADVFLFDAVGARETSQSLVGFDDSSLPVHTEITAPVDTDRVLYIHKTTADGKTPIEGIVFDIYKVATSEELSSGTVTISSVPTADEVTTYATSDRLVGTVTTSASGNAVFNFTTNNQPDGAYLIIERDNDKVVQPVAPFYITVPMEDPSGDGTLNAVHVYPKNDLKPTVPDTPDTPDTPTLPDTGGIGTTIFTVTGIVLMMAAIAAFLIIKKKNKA